MDASLALLTLLHVLIPVYWLGGDLGAFYGSSFMVDPERSVTERMMALRILNNIDMAPRTALILAFPTGFGLAAGKGWVAVTEGAVTVVWLFFLAWLALVWTVHLKHGPQGVLFKRVDIGVRYLVLAALVAGGGAGLAGAAAIPLFMALKLLILATCVALGLLVRRQLVPLFPAIVKMRESGATPETDRVIAAVNDRARISVLSIWALVLIASFLGLATPV